MTPNKQIVFFDGDCGFCNSTIEFVLRHEKQDQLYFTALQSDFTVDFLKDHCLPEPDFSTLYRWKNGKLHQKSTASLEISKFLNHPIPICLFLKSHLVSYEILCMISLQNIEKKLRMMLAIYRQ